MPRGAQSSTSTVAGHCKSLQCPVSGTATSTCYTSPYLHIMLALLLAKPHPQLASRTIAFPHMQ